MSSPAYNATVTTVDTFTTKYWPNWDPYRPPPVHGSNGSRISAMRYPATIINPRRPDGTRAMSSYYKEWFRVVNPRYSYIAAPKSGMNWVYDVSNAAVMPSLPLWTAPSDMGLLWERVNNTYAVFTPRLEIVADNVARTKVLTKVSRKKWDLGVTALELKQTAGLVTDLATGMAQTVLGLMDAKGKAGNSVSRLFREVVREGDFYKAAEKVGLRNTEVLNRIRDRWMQYQFGVRPLLQDVDDAVNLLSERIHGSNFKVLVVGKAGHQMTGTADTQWFQSNFPGMTEQSVRYQEECRVHYSVVYELPTGQVPLYQALGLDNPSSLTWEVTRLSWMFDYAVGVGDWLQSFTATRGLLFREGSRSTLRRLVSVDLNNRLRPEGRRYTFTKNPSIKGLYVEHGHFRRDLLTHGVTPAFVPQIKSELGLVQLANSIFALSNVLGGKPGLR